MTEKLTFHFEGALADLHRMNFYEAARFQYAAARLMVKLCQFRQKGRFTKKITNKSNFNVQLVSHSDGSFNINIEDDRQKAEEKEFVDVPLSDLLAYVSERVVEKIDEPTLKNARSATRISAAADQALQIYEAADLERLVNDSMSGRVDLDDLSPRIRDLIRRRIAEIYREQRLTANQSNMSLIDFARSQKLISMSAPLLSEIATALRRSADTLEVTSSLSDRDRPQPLLFLDQDMAQAIETAIVEKEITPFLGDITQFNKDNGWGKLKIEDGLRTLSFSIPSDILPRIKQQLIDHMKRDLVYLQTYPVRDRSGEIIRLIAVGVIPTPTS